MNPPPIRPASTILLLRQAQDAAEVFMVRRSGHGFMAGATVFPGGKVDPGDSAPSLLKRSALQAKQAAERLGLPEEPDVALGYYIAALRETFEEAGILLARSSEGHMVDSDAAPFPKLRQALHREELSFLELLEEQNLTLATDALVYFAHWLTPEFESRRYDTRFFLATAPAKATGVHDAVETVESSWVQPKSALKAARSGTYIFPPPTMKSLELLAAQPTLQEILAWARAEQPSQVCPEIEFDDNSVPNIILPGDPGSSITEAAFPGPTRYLLEDGRWSPVLG